MEVPLSFILLALMLLVAMSFMVGWLLARSFQPVGGTNITWFSGARSDDPNLVPEQCSPRLRPVAEPADSQSIFESPVRAPPGQLGSVSPVPVRHDLSTDKGKYWINPHSFTMHRRVEICGTGRSVCCGAQQPNKLEQVYLCQFCWPIDRKKSR